MGAYENVDSPNKTRDPRGNRKGAGVPESRRLVRLRVELQPRVGHRYILRRRAATKLNVGGVFEWMARRMRIRVPAYSFRAAGLGALAVVIVGPITLTLLAGHEDGLSGSLSRIERFSLSLAETASPRLAALQDESPTIQPRRANDAATLTAGNIPYENTSQLSESLPNAAVNEVSARLAASSTAADSPLPVAANEGATKDAAATSGWPLAPSRGRVDQKLRDGYLWRAWLEEATKFHAKRTHGKSLLIYHPGEGYAVLDAAYRPMIQPVQPGGADKDKEDRSVYQDRREPREAPEDSTANDGSTNPDEPPPVVRPRRGGSGRLGSGVQSFQPWDSEAMTEPMSAAKALVSHVPGLRIDRVVLFQGFSSNGYPAQGGMSPYLQQNLGYDIDVGAMATISWTRSRPTGSVFMMYTPSYLRRSRYSEWNSLDQQLAFGVNKKLRRWDLGVQSSNAVRGLPEVLFSPAVTRTVDSPPASFDDLVHAAEGGQLSSDEIASVLTGTPVIDKQPKTRFDEGQVLSMEFSATAAYSASPRLTLSAVADANRYQTLSTPASADSEVGLIGLRRATSIGGTGGANYQLSPSLTVGVTSTVRQSHSDYFDARSVNTSGTINKRLGRRWSVKAGGGIGMVNSENVASLTATPRTRSSWIVDAGLRYSGRAHTFAIDGRRSLGDSVGLGGGVSYGAGAQWQWNRPGAEWGLYSHANWYKISLDGYPGTGGAFVGGGLIRQLTRETSFQAEYSYQMFNSPFRGVVSNLNGHRVQMSWVWKPTGPPR